MKVVIMRTNLKEGLSLVERSVGDATRLPILKNVLIECNDKGIIFTSTNLEIATTCTVPGKIIEEGGITVPLSLFLTLVNNLPSERVNLETKQNKLEIVTDNYYGHITGLPKEEFPLIPHIEDTKEFLEIDGEVLREALSQVVVAAQFSDLRPELQSVLFSYSLDTLTFVATDVFRLAEKTLYKNQFKSYYKKEFKCLIPLKTVHEFLRIVKTNERIKAFFDATQVLFTSGRFELISRLVNGVFPEYTAIIPKQFTAELIVNRQEFINSLKITGVLGNKNSEVRVTCGDNKKTIEVLSSDQALGDNRYVLFAKIHNSFDHILFNWRYLLDGLKVFTADEVFIGINTDNKPALLKDTKNTSFFYILAPLLPAS